MQLTRVLGHIRRLRDADRGVAMLELALGMPLVLAMGGYGAEIANYAIVSQRVNQAALQVADNASRVGNVSSDMATFQLREVDLNDILQGARLTSSGIKLTTRGRITISSLENIQQSYDSTPVQRIHWQRCLGLRGGSADPGYDSSYGAAGSTNATLASAGSTSNQADAGTAMPNGMGDAPAAGQPDTRVNAPSGSALIFVEVNYQYQPLFSAMFVSSQKIHYIASFIVRDRRDFAQIYNPSPTSTASTCDKYTT